MNLLFLYTELMGYTLSTLKVLSEHGYNIHVVHWDHKKLTPFKPMFADKIELYRRSANDVKSMLSLAKYISPEITYVSGWQDADYLTVARQIRRSNKPVVTGFDDIWYGTARQRTASVFCKFGYLSKFFSNAWVSGPWQFEYSQRMGFTKEQVIFDLLCADTRVFQGAYAANHERKKNDYPHRFLFVGRLEARKGIRTLLNAWNDIRPYRKDWKLQIIGGGTYWDELTGIDDIELVEFQQPEDLVTHIQNAGCFLLPSLREPWGVVVHEFAAAGLPLILSNSVGSSSTFLIPGFNGFSFKSGNVQSLSQCMKAIIDTKDTELAEMGTRSNQLSSRITPQSSASSLLSLISCS